jgi:hypothetical protein
MKKLKKFLNLILLRLKAKTPKVWKFVCHAAYVIPLLITFINTATAGTIVPEWYTVHQFYILGVCGVISFFAGTRVTQEGKEDVNTKLNET